MTTWKVTNLNTGEVGYVRTYNNIWACEALGWKFSYCDVEELKGGGEA